MNSLGSVTVAIHEGLIFMPSGLASILFLFSAFSYNKYFHSVAQPLFKPTCVYGFCCRKQTWPDKGRASYFVIGKILELGLKSSTSK